MLMLPPAAPTTDVMSGLPGLRSGDWWEKQTHAVACSDTPEPGVHTSVHARAALLTQQEGEAAAQAAKGCREGGPACLVLSTVQRAVEGSGSGSGGGSRSDNGSKTVLAVILTPGWGGEAVGRLALGPLEPLAGDGPG